MTLNLQAREEQIIREKQLEHEERMAKELARINYENEREKRIRQYIKENRYASRWFGVMYCWCWGLAEEDKTLWSKKESCVAAKPCGSSPCV